MVVCLLSLHAYGDLFVGHLSKNDCRVLKTKQTVLEYVRGALGKKEIDVTHDKEGHCGEGAYLMRKTNHERWAVFATKENCQCYLRASSLFDKGK